MIPCAFVLLVGKSEILYRAMLRELKEGALGLSLELSPEVLMTDFELAAMNAFRYNISQKLLFWVVISISVKAYSKKLLM